MWTASRRVGARAVPRRERGRGVLVKEVRAGVRRDLLRTEVVGEQGAGRGRTVHGRALAGGAETARGGGAQSVEFAEDPAEVERRVAPGDLFAGEQEGVVTGRGGDQPAGAGGTVQQDRSSPAGWQLGGLGPAGRPGPQTGAEPVAGQGTQPGTVRGVLRGGVGRPREPGPEPSCAVVGPGLPELPRNIVRLPLRPARVRQRPWWTAEGAVRRSRPPRGPDEAPLGPSPRRRRTRGPSHANGPRRAGTGAGPVPGSPRAGTAVGAARPAGGRPRQMSPR